MTKKTTTRRNTRKPATKRRTSSKKKSATAPGWMWMISGIMVGLLISGVFYLHQLRKLHHLRAQEHARTHPTHHATKHHQPTFDFYTMLSHNTVAAKKMRHSEHYFVRVGTATNADDVNHLQAELSLIGFAVTINKLESNPSVSAIDVGPFDSVEAAKSNKQALADNHFYGTIIKRSR